MAIEHEFKIKGDFVISSNSLEIVGTFEKIEYRLYVYRKVLKWMKLPTKIGKWLFRLGLAVRVYVNITVSDTDIKFDLYEGADEGW